MDAGEASGALRLAGEQRAWLDDLAALGPPAGGVPVPGAGPARALLSGLGFRPADAGDVLRNRPERDTAPWLWWLLERAYHQLLAGMGSTQNPPPWPQLPDQLGPAGAHLYSWLFLAALPAARANHARRGVPHDVSRVTLADFARQAALCRRLYGRGGLAAPKWLALHFRGGLFELGRLQFQRSLVAARDVRPVPADAAGDVPVLDLHIPQAGPLTPDLVDGSLESARVFFPRHFPEERHEFAVCTSWLLDDQLAEYLPETSNIVAFQRRFRLIPDKEGAYQDEQGVRESDGAVVEFVFRRPRGLPLADRDLVALPQDTALQRTIVTHLRQGRHWRWRSGWFRM